MIENARILSVLGAGWLAALAPLTELHHGIPPAAPAPSVPIAAGQPGARKADTLLGVHGAQLASDDSGADAPVGFQRHVDASGAVPTSDRCEYSVRVRGLLLAEGSGNESTRATPHLVVDASITCADARLDSTDILAGTGPLEPAELEHLLERRAAVVVGREDPCAYLPDLTFVDGKLSVRRAARLCAAGLILSSADPNRPDVVEPPEDGSRPSHDSLGAEGAGDRVEDEPTGRLRAAPPTGGTSGGVSSTLDRSF